MGLLTPATDGTLRGERLLTTAFMAPRLQATLEDDGALKIALWGGGDLGVLRLDLDWSAPFIYGPNTIKAANGFICAAQSQPVLLIQNARLKRFTPARKPAKWAKNTASADHSRSGNTRLYRLPWGMISISQHGSNVVVAAGAHDAEWNGAHSLPLDKIISEAAEYAAACDAMPEASALLRSMVLQGAHTALASRRYLHGGRFAGLAAGMNYSFPSRTYYRDGHWTLQALLHLDPDCVREQIAILAGGIHADGEAPSAIIAADAAQLEAWTEFRLSNEKETAAHQGTHDWWSDHTDSPLFFILTIGDYCTATKDKKVYQQYQPVIEAIFNRYVALAAEGDGLPQKPRHDRDWADNVFRAGDVSYICGLWLAALNVILALDDGDLARSATAARREALAALPRLMTSHQWPLNYADRKQNLREDNFSLDTLTLSLGNMPDSHALLSRMREVLETRNNPDQPWGDWGVMCAWPPYSHRQDLRGKTIFAYRYHNGSDWPWLDGLYAREMLRHGMDGWEYPLLRWWSYSLEKGWTSPVEYYSPSYGRGSLLQGWSSMAAAAALSYKSIILQKMRR